MKESSAILTRVSADTLVRSPPVLNPISYLPNWWNTLHGTWGCFTNVSRALQKIFSRILYITKIVLFYENFKLKLCTCARSHVLGTRTEFQLEIISICVISGIVYFREIILVSWRNNSLHPLMPFSVCENIYFILDSFPKISFWCICP